MFFLGLLSGVAITTQQYTLYALHFPDQDGAEPSGNSVSCHNLQRLAAYADKSAAAEGGESEREMAFKLIKAFSKRLNDSPSALPEMMSAVMFYNDSPTQVCLSFSVELLMHGNIKFDQDSSA